MNASKIFKGSLLGLSLLLASAAFAASKGSFEISKPVSVAGKQLAAGNYTVEWDGAGPDVQVSFLSGKKVVATAAAHVANVDRSPDHSEAVVNVNPDGTRTLSEIRLSGKKYILSLGDNAGGGQGSGSSMR